MNGWLTMLASARRVMGLGLVALAMGCAGPDLATKRHSDRPQPTGSRAHMEGYARAEIDRCVLPNAADAWTEQAQWDEYGVVLRNTGALPVVVTALELSGDPGGPTWHTTWADSLRRDSAARAGPDEHWASIRPVVTVLGAVGLASCHLLYLPPAIPLCLATAGVAIPVAARLRQEQAGIDERGLRLPLSISPGEEVRGAGFFARSPRADGLRVHLNIEGEDHVLEIRFAPVRAREAVVPARSLARQ